MSTEYSGQYTPGRMMGISRPYIILSSIILIILLTASAVPGAKCTNFEPGHLRVVEIRGHWKLIDGPLELDFGRNRREAYRAQKIINHYGMNQRCTVGWVNDPSLEYYLVEDGRPPKGAIFGEDCIPFNPGEIDVEFIRGRWKIVEGRHWILDFGGFKKEAEEGKNIITGKNFKWICFIGRPNPAMTYFRQ